MTLLWRLFAAFVLVTAGAAAACGSNDGGTAGSGTATRAGTPATVNVAEGSSVLNAARLETAKLTGLKFLDIELHDLAAAGFSSSCVGVKQPPNVPCTADLAAGFVAFFRAENRDLRYHFLGRKMVGPIAPSQVEGVSSSLGPSLHVDLGSELARYARDDFAVRQNVSVSSLAVTNVVPANGGAVVVINGGGQSGAYQVAPAAGISLLSSPPAIAPGISSLELAMRQDLAKRLKADLATISILNYELVTWPDGCIGVQKPGTVCSQALVPGFLAVLADGVGKTYRYHGTGDSYTAASFESGATLTEPVRSP